MDYALMVNIEQAQLLKEMLELPQITVPFTKAKTAGFLYANVCQAVDSLTSQEKSGFQHDARHI